LAAVAAEMLNQTSENLHDLSARITYGEDVVRYWAAQCGGLGLAN
jgi:hypothetical protein